MPMATKTRAGDAHVSRRSRRPLASVSAARVQDGDSSSWAPSLPREGPTSRARNPAGSSRCRDVRGHRYVSIARTARRGPVPHDRRMAPGGSAAGGRTILRFGWGADSTACRMADPDACRDAARRRSHCVLTRRRHSGSVTRCTVDRPHGQSTPRQQHWRGRSSSPIVSVPLSNGIT